MITAIIDRIEGNYAVAEFSPPIGQAFFSDILLDNLQEKVSEGDVLHIFEINGIDFSNQSACMYKDITRADVLKKFVEPLKSNCPCKIEISHSESRERSSKVKSMISDLFK